MAFLAPAGFTRAAPLATRGPSAWIFVNLKGPISKGGWSIQRNQVGPPSTLPENYISKQLASPGRGVVQVPLSDTGGTQLPLTDVLPPSRFLVCLYVWMVKLILQQEAPPWACFIVSSFHHFTHPIWPALHKKGSGDFKFSPVALAVKLLFTFLFIHCFS